jgi:hypothetical protein
VPADLPRRPRLRVLDLFSGRNGWGDPFRKAGHEVFAIDIDRRFSADAYLDIGDVACVLEAVPWQPDVIFASPPCNSFSTGSMGKMWQHGSFPSPKRSHRHRDGHPIAVEGMRLVLATLRIIAVLQPAYWVIENPRGRLRSLDLLAGVPRRTVWYCRLGLDRAKPTDLWGVFPPGLLLPPGCHNGKPRPCRSATWQPDWHAGWRQYRGGGAHPAPVGGAVPGRARAGGLNTIRPWCRPQRSARGRRRQRHRAVAQGLSPDRRRGPPRAGRA